MRILNTLRESARLAKLSWRLGLALPPGHNAGAILARLKTISRHVDCPHNASHALAFGVEILSLPPSVPGCIVEAGCYKGGSTAKFSIFAKIAGRSLAVFDSFEGLPDNQEAHDKSVLGHSIEGWFEKGKFRGALEEVQRNIRQYGEIEVCRFIQGWFEDTMPGFAEPIAAAYLDVDLASSTRTCLKHLYPLLSPGGALFSQDGDFPLVIEVFRDERFWKNEVGCARPAIEGLGKEKLIAIRKPA